MVISDLAGLLAFLTALSLALGFVALSFFSKTTGQGLFMLAALLGLARLVLVGPSFVAVIIGSGGLLGALFILRPRGETAIKLAVCAFLVGTALPHFAAPLAEGISRLPLGQSLPDGWMTMLPSISPAILICAGWFLGAGIIPVRAGGALAVYGVVLAWPFRDLWSTHQFPVVTALSFLVMLYLAIVPDTQLADEEISQ